MDHRQIIGQTLIFDYASETYEIAIVSETQVRWVQRRGDRPGSGDVEDYVYSELTEEMAMITWVEADGLGLSNVLDFSAKTVTTHASHGRAVFVNAGRLSVLRTPQD